MAAVKANSDHRANQGLSLEMVKQLLEVPCPKRQLFASCRDPDKSEVSYQQLKQQHKTFKSAVKFHPKIKFV